MIYVYNMETGARFGFAAGSAREAMEKMRYTLDITRKDPAAEILTTPTGKTVYMTHCGETFAALN